MKLLFILKKFSAYGYGYNNAASGLYNSAKFVVDMLNAAHVPAELVEVVDNNDIDRVVTATKPDVVIIEALWVVPEKFDVLAKLHPYISWIVRGHSDLPFLAQEGVAIDWIFGYLKHPNVLIALNSPRVINDLKALTPPELRHKILYLPNYYPAQPIRRSRVRRDSIAIGCFGAIRPLKNQLVQAVAAIRYADSVGRKLDFHINDTRCETGGSNVLRNLRSLFANTRHNLVEWDWLARADFLAVLGQMDFELAVSLSETFCITAADAASLGIPLVCSAEVPWASRLSVVTPATDAAVIAQRLMDTIRLSQSFWNVYWNRVNLRKYSKRAREIWLRHFR